MVALSAGKISQYIKSPDKSARSILIYGPDQGLVREYASGLARYYSTLSGETGEIIIIDDSEAGAQPDKLAVELQMIPMFGGNKVIRYRPGSKTDLDIIAEHIDSHIVGSCLIVEGGDLKKNVRLRQIFEKSKNAVAIPCYADEGRSLIDIINEELAHSNISATQSVKQYLAGQLGADRGLSRSEIQKLLLYVDGKKSIETDDIDAVVGDSSALSIDAILFATTGGKLGTALENFDRAIAAGNSPSSVLILLNRHIARLHRIRAEMDRGENLDFSVKRLRPPLHFKHQDEFKRQIGRWSERQLLIALDLAQQTTFRCRTRSAMETVFIERLILSICQMAGKQ